MHRWDGRVWSAVPSPGDVVGMHGKTVDFIVAVGADGLIARWDGSMWTRVASPTATTLSAVHVESEDEMYAVGPGRRVLTGSHAGWVELLEAPGPMFGVTKFANTVWIGGADQGLLKLVDNKLEAFKPNFRAEILESRVDLLVSSPDKIGGSVDGVAFVGFGVAGPAGTMAKTPPMWVK